MCGSAVEPPKRLDRDLLEDVVDGEEHQSTVITRAVDRIRIEYSRQSVPDREDYDALFVDLLSHRTVG